MTIQIEVIFWTTFWIILLLAAGLCTLLIRHAIEKKMNEAIEIALWYQYVDGFGVVNGHNGELYKIKDVERYRGAYRTYVSLKLENKHGYQRWVNTNNIRVAKELYLKEVAE